MDLASNRTEIVAIAAAIVAGLVVLEVARSRLGAAWTRRRLRIRYERAAAGEARAEELLLTMGYSVEGRQVTTSYGVSIDGTAVSVDLRADYVVAKGKRRYVAEVKTGRSAPRFDTPATRRQLLEYRCAFDVDGVLLVDAESERVSVVEFPFFEERERAPSSGWWMLALAALALGVATALTFALSP